MSHMLIHVVFAFKFRKTMSSDFCEYLESQLFYLAEQYNALPEAVSIHDQNHIHLLINLPRTKALSDIIRNIKARSAYLARKDFGHSGRLYQKTYLYNSVGSSGTKRATDYINRFKSQAATEKVELPEFTSMEVSQ